MRQRTPRGEKAPEPNRTADGQLACAFHEPWLGRHFLCQAYTEGLTGKPAILPDYCSFAPKQLGPKPDQEPPSFGQGVLFAAEDR